MFRYLLALSLVLITATVTTAQSTTAFSAHVYRTVNVRSGPGTQYAIIGRLSGGMEVSVTGRSDAESNWLALEFDGQQGWVAFFTVTLNGDPEQLPILEPAAMLPVAVESIQGDSEALSNVYVTAFRRVNVRSGPTASTDRLGVLFPGSQVDIVGRTADNQWLLISYNAEVGWVAYFVVTVTGDLDTVPIYAEDARSTGTVAATTATVTVITRFNSNLRLQPDSASPVLAVIPFATALQVDARTPNRTWIRVNYDGESGWILASLVSAVGNANLADVPVAD
ncbi:MAG: SH3 domain-containing protein [Anaerolineae bacterium]|nr:SH3 domain-containing protein [Anaerolineae bacterium]